MKKSRFTNEQIAFALKQAESGVPVEEVCRKLGVSQPTFYRWKKKFDGMGVEELRRLRNLEEENKRLKSLVADLSLDKQILQDVAHEALKTYGPRFREHATWNRQEFIAFILQVRLLHNMLSQC